MAVDRHDDEGRFWLFVALCALVVAVSLAWLGTHPEPCQDPNTTACATPYRGDR